MLDNLTINDLPDGVVDVVEVIDMDIVLSNIYCRIIRYGGVLC